jgi:glycosyltransferase involved in cell wall biosynthesis
MTIFVGCPSRNTPSGGNKKLYRHVDILNKHGFSSSIVHLEDDVRLTWFDNATRVTYASQIVDKLCSSDYIVMPEDAGPGIAQIKKGVRKVIFNQGCYNTFNSYSLDKDGCLSPYNSHDLVAALVVSEDSKNYLQYVYPDLKVFRIHNGIDPTIYRYRGDKKRQIAFASSKMPRDVLQVICILKMKGLLKYYDLVEIDKIPEARVAEILKRSLIFLSFNYQEGFGLLPAEAMACGCLVVGYHGQGGKEYFDPQFSYPVPQADVIAFAKAVEQVIKDYETDRSYVESKAIQAAAYISRTYSMEREEADVVNFWRNIELEAASESSVRLLSGDRRIEGQMDV